jgi:hypothetical protein
MVPMKIQKKHKIIYQVTVDFILAESNDLSIQHTREKVH